MVANHLLSPFNPKGHSGRSCAAPSFAASGFAALRGNFCILLATKPLSIQIK